MNKTLCALALAALAWGHAETQSAAKQKPKAAPAVQMPGDNGKLGVVYRLGAPGDELFFVLEKAEFAMRGVSREETLLARPDQRLLKLTFAVQNPHRTDKHFFEQSFGLTVVAPDDQNYVFRGWVSHPDRGDRLNLQLKPAQKVRAVAYIPIHPSGPVNKLIVQRGQNTKVLRYDLRDKVQPLTGAFADQQGVASLAVGKAKPNEVFMLGPFDVLVEGAQEILGPLGDITPAEQGKLVVVTLRVKNATLVPQDLHHSIITPTLVDANNEPLEWTFNMLRMSSEERLNQRLEPGQELRTRLVFKAPQAVKPTLLTLKEQASERSVSIPVTAQP